MGNLAFVVGVNQDNKSGMRDRIRDGASEELVEYVGVCGVCIKILGRFWRLMAKRGDCFRAALEWTAEGSCPYMARVDERVRR